MQVHGNDRNPILLFITISIISGLAYSAISKEGVHIILSNVNKLNKGIKNIYIFRNDAHRNLLGCTAIPIICFVVKKNRIFYVNKIVILIKQYIIERVIKYIKSLFYTICI